MAASTAQASILTFTSSTAFFSALGSTSTVTETYEGIPINTVVPAGSNLNGINYDAFNTSSGSISGRIDDTYNRIDNASLSAERAGTNDFFFAGDSFSVTFPQSVTAVGIFFNRPLAKVPSDPPQPPLKRGEKTIYARGLMPIQPHLLQICLYEHR